MYVFCLGHHKQNSLKFLKLFYKLLSILRFKNNCNIHDLTNLSDFSQQSSQDVLKTLVYIVAIKTYLYPYNYSYIKLNINYRIKCIYLITSPPLELCFVFTTKTTIFTVFHVSYMTIYVETNLYRMHLN